MLRILSAAAAVAAMVPVVWAQSRPQTTAQENGAQAGRKTVPLVSDACPVVHDGDHVSLDWYPGFDLEGIVTGLRNFTLVFKPISADGVNLISRSELTLGGRGGEFEAAPMANGYFHVEWPVRRGTQPGVYQLVDASSMAATVPEYHGEQLQMTNSPVTGRYCITVAGPRQAKQQNAVGSE